MNQHGIFINQSWSCCLVSIHHELYDDIQMIQCGGVCVSVCGCVGRWLGVANVYTELAWTERGGGEG